MGAAKKVNTEIIEVIDASLPSPFQPAMLLTPPVSRAAYSDRTAWLMAKCSQLAYFPFEKNIPLFDRSLARGGFERLALFNCKETQAYLAARKDMAVLAFRGTENKEEDIRTDLKIRFYQKRGADVHSGFMSAYKSIEVQIEHALRSIGGLPLYITGHSLGGALATIAALKLERDQLAACYTFGSPRVGQDEFDGEIKTPVYRVVNSNDLVTWVPLMSSGYQHVGDLKYLTSNGDLIRSPSGFRIFKRFCSGLLSNWKSSYKDHSIDEYCRKLAQYAVKRNT
jgi:hypothetical protein